MRRFFPIGADFRAGVKARPAPHDRSLQAPPPAPGWTLNPEAAHGVDRGCPTHAGMDSVGGCRLTVPRWLPPADWELETYEQGKAATLEGVYKGPEPGVGEAEESRGHMMTMGQIRHTTPRETTLVGKTCRGRLHDPVADQRAVECALRSGQFKTAILTGGRREPLSCSVVKVVADP